MEADGAGDAHRRIADSLVICEENHVRHHGEPRRWRIGKAISGLSCSTRAQDCAGAINILTTAASRAAALLALSLAQEGMLMSTYEEFMIIIAVAGLIVSILNLTHKNSRPDPQKV